MVLDRGVPEPFKLLSTDMAGKTKNCKHEIASRLPSKLYERLMPFQKEGVEFAVRKNGRFVYVRVLWIQTRTYLSFRVSASRSVQTLD